MGFKIIAKKRFLNSFKKITSYLKKEWGKSVAEEFKTITTNKLDLIASQPNIGANTAIKNTKSVLVGKGYQNKIYYRVEKNKLIIINLIDTRKKPKQNRYYK
ncbi:MAG: type II toxin-antitoxin system RelE/ParE family toxin [Ferruginibacter sp.]